MGKTGRYVFRDGKCIKISDATPKVASRVDGAYYPGSPYYEYFNGREPVLITSKGHKKEEMARRGIVEKGDEDIPYETSGKIYSYKGQKHRDRNTQPTRKVPKSMKHLANNL